MTDSDPKPESNQPDTTGPTTAAQPAAPPQRPVGEGAAPADAMAEAGGDGAELHPSAERELWTGRTSWKHFYGKWVLWGLAMIVIVVGGFWLRRSWATLGNIASLSFIGGLAILAVASFLVLWIQFALKIYAVRYRVTTQRLFVERGILSRTTDQNELIRVDDVRVRQGIVDRLVNVGSVDILSTDVSDGALTLVGVAEPDKIAEHVRQRMRTLRRKSLFVENL